MLFAATRCKARLYTITKMHQAFIIILRQSMTRKSFLYVLMNNNFYDAATNTYVVVLTHYDGNKHLIGIYKGLSIN